MTLVNWRILPQRVELVTDTATYRPDGAHVRKVTKFVPMAHARMVAVYIGRPDVAVSLYDLAANCTDVDDFAQRAPEELALVHEWISRLYAEDVKSNTTKFALADWQVAAFGWSTAKNRMVGHAFSSTNGFVVEAAKNEILVPDIARDATNPAVAAVLQAHKWELERFESPRTYIALAKLQAISMKEQTGVAAIGGELILLELTKSVCSIRSIYQFPEPIAGAAA